MDLVNLLNCMDGGSIVNNTHTVLFVLSLLVICVGGLLFFGLLWLNVYFRVLYSEDCKTLAARSDQKTFTYNNIWYSGSVQAGTAEEAVVKFNQMFRVRDIPLQCQLTNVEQDT